MTTTRYQLGARPTQVALYWHYVVCKMQRTNDTVCAAIALYPDCRTFHILSGTAWLQRQWRQRATFYIEGRQIGINEVRIQLHPIDYNSGRLIWVYRKQWSRHAC